MPSPAHCIGSRFFMMVFYIISYLHVNIINQKDSKYMVALPSKIERMMTLTLLPDLSS